MWDWDHFITFQFNFAKWLFSLVIFPFIFLLALLLCATLPFRCNRDLWTNTLLVRLIVFSQFESIVFRNLKLYFLLKKTLSLHFQGLYYQNASFLGVSVQLDLNSEGLSWGGYNRTMLLNKERCTMAKIPHLIINE